MALNKRSFRDVIIKPPARPKPVQITSRTPIVPEDLEMALQCNFEWGDIVSEKSISDLIKKQNLSAKRSENGRLIVQIPKTPEVPKVSETSKVPENTKVHDNLKAVLETPKQISETPKAVLETPKAVLETPKAVLETSKMIPEVPKSVSEHPKISENPKVSESSKQILEIPKLISENPKLISETLKVVPENLKSPKTPKADQEILTSPKDSIVLQDLPTDDLTACVLPMFNSPPSSAKTNASEPKPIVFSPMQSDTMDDILQSIKRSISATEYPTYSQILSASYSQLRYIPHTRHTDFWNRVYNQFNIHKTPKKRSISCSASIGSTFVSQINRANTFYVTSETELPTIDMPVFTQKVSIDEALHQRDFFASEATRNSHRVPVYNKSLFQRFHSKGFRKWCSLDAEYNRIAFEETSFSSSYKHMWAVFVDGKHKGIHCTEKDAKEFGKQLVNGMDFPFTVGVFQIQTVVLSPPVSVQPLTAEAAVSVQPLTAEAAVSVQPVTVDAAVNTNNEEPVEINESYTRILEFIEHHLYAQSEAISTLQTQFSELHTCLERPQELEPETTVWEDLWDMFVDLWCFRRNRSK